ncbi:MAG: ATP synthase F1 subunit gamma [Bacteroidota bacterium]|nr:ATP synthase F1 subunit gamma [Bacteroidota bacterium]MDX5427797.1 ATP synthase F1 subunit gamma [Bacteroidota bacterium]MDX5448615.1 ATP synthase F1 subunit gamma [Bacteroidota bacterium]MDX5505677.1 ATP synthase F1 subunit gamma [Bacteroidota bacterium]
MANLKELRNRIVSIGSTMQITSAMKMVSAAKLKRAQDSIIKMRPYAEKLTEILQNLSATLDTSENQFAIQREVNNVLIIPVTSNRGLCGAFNSQVLKRSRNLVAQYKQQGANVKVMTIGKKAFDNFKKGGAELVGSEIEIWNDLSFENASVIAENLMQGFLNGDFDKVILVYNHFKNAASQEVLEEQFLPVKPVEGDRTATSDYIFEPGKREILEDLIPKSLKTQVFKALLDSNASEHGARMTAMHKATDNAKELQGDLKLEYNKARQASITNEILEIVGGADALEG